MTGRVPTRERARTMEKTEGGVPMATVATPTSSGSATERVRTTKTRGLDRATEQPMPPGTKARARSLGLDPARADALERAADDAKSALEVRAEKGGSRSRADGGRGRGRDGGRRKTNLTPGPPGESGDRSKRAARWQRPSLEALKGRTLTQEDRAWLETVKEAAYRGDRRTIEAIASRFGHDRLPPGDLTPSEVRRIRNHVDKYACGWGCPGVVVVGSAARGQRRGIEDPSLPIGKGEGGRSDIDYALHPRHQHLAYGPGYEERWHGLPSVDSTRDEVLGTIGAPFADTHAWGDQPGIYFFKGRAPIYIPGGVLPERRDEGSDFDNPP